MRQGRIYWRVPAIFHICVQKAKVAGLKFFFEKNRMTFLQFWVALHEKIIFNIQSLKIEKRILVIIHFFKNEIFFFRNPVFSFWIAPKLSLTLDPSKLKATESWRFFISQKCKSNPSLLFSNGVLPARTIFKIDWEL